jgi:hypothetical protein
MAPNMMDYEKRISFLNRYFVFQKIATRNVEKLTKSILEHLPDELEFEEKQTAIAQKVVEKVDKELKPKVKNLKKKILLQGQDVELAIEEEDKPAKAEVQAVVVEEHVLEKDKKKKIKKTKKAEEPVVEPAEAVVKKKTTRKKKVLIGEINEE